MSRLLLSVAAALAIAPALAQQAANDSPVHATLRLAGERNTFKMGEPILMEDDNAVTMVY